MLRSRLSKRSRYHKSRRLLVTTALSNTIDLDIIEDSHVSGKTHSDDALSVDSSDDDFRFDATLRDRSAELPEAESSTEVLVTQQLLDANPENMLGQLETECVVAVLADLNDQLQALRHLLPCAVKVDHLEYKTIEERFSGLSTTTKLIYPAESATPAETSPMKVERVRRYLAAIVQRTGKEAQVDGTFDTLRRAVEDDGRMRLEAERLRREERDNAEEVSRLMALREKMAKVVRDKVARSRVMVKTIEGEQHDATLTANVERRTVRKWEAALSEQGAYTLDEEQTYYQDQLIMCRSSIDEEYRVNSEIESYHDMVKRGLQESIESWRELYEKDLEEKDREMLQLKITREAQLNKYEITKETYQSREKEIQDYLMVREERRIRTELAAFLNKMATRIQAWWRGVMVRRKLGPHRKKKKGAKNKAKRKGKALQLIEETQKGKKV